MKQGPKWGRLKKNTEFENLVQVCREKNRYILVAVEEKNRISVLRRVVSEWMHRKFCADFMCTYTRYLQHDVVELPYTGSTDWTT